VVQSQIRTLIIALVSAFSVVATGRTSDGAQYELHPLAVVGGQVDAFALGINNSNQVAGYIVDEQGSSHAATWTTSSVRLLPELFSERPFSQAYRINDAGQIVGKSRTADGAVHATLWRSLEVRDLGTLSGRGDSFATDINEQGTVVGSSDAEVGVHAFSWTAERGFVDFGNTDPPFRLAVAGFNGVNNTGLMVGTSYILLEPYRAAFAREGDRGLTDLSPPGRNSLGMALAVNDSGVIVGYQNGDAGGPQAAIFQQDGSFESLGTLGLEESWAQDVNQAGTIVGRAFSFAPGGGLIPKAFVYDQGEMVDLLEAAINPGDWTLVEAAGINDAGVIVGSGLFEGKPRAYIAIPIPEPASIWILIIGTLVLLTWNGRRFKRNP
jgi:probable HAF family extracellular repeat protein